MSEALIFQKLRREVPSERQIEFFCSTAAHTAYGGARGGGKSFAMRRKLVMLAMRYPRLRLLLLRRTLSELRENHILPLQSELAGYADYKKEERSFLFPNGSRLTLGYCDCDGDMLQYQGTEYDVIGFEEATHFKEEWMVFKGVHEPIIDRETFEAVQKLTKKTKRRAPKSDNAEKNMFCDLLYCADCGSKLWSHVNTINKDIQYFSCSNYKVDTRGTCETRHYIRADAIEQVVMLELKRMARFLQIDEEAFADLLAQKTQKDIINEQKALQGELQRCTARNQKVAELYEKLYEDNVSGKVTDEWFMQLSHKYEVERMELKIKIASLNERINNLGTMQQNKDRFINAIRRFMEMQKLTAPLLRELIDEITVYETEGVGKNRSQRIMIHYKFIGYIEIPECGSNYKADTRKGVAVEYITKSA